MRLSINVGEVIREKYRVEDVLCAGAMGVVLSAWDRDLEECAAGLDAYGTIAPLRAWKLASMAVGGHAEASSEFFSDQRGG